jgi:hypothetical protein
LSVRDTIALASAWPGWGDQHTLVLPIDPRDWPPPSRPLEVDACTFAPKHELHVTVVGKVLGARIRAAIGDGRIDDNALRQALATQCWRLRRSGWRLRLRKEAVESVIEPVALPAMARMHAWLGRALGESLPVPPPHVTLYVRGDAEGIGVPDCGTLARLRVGTPWRV